jgi:hypothetical protein
VVFGRGVDPLAEEVRRTGITRAHVVDCARQPAALRATAVPRLRRCVHRVFGRGYDSDVVAPRVMPINAAAAPEMFSALSGVFGVGDPATALWELQRKPSFPMAWAENRPRVITFAEE